MEKERKLRFSVLCQFVFFYFSSKTPFSKLELSSILKFGAEELFKDDNEDEEPQVR